MTGYQDRDGSGEALMEIQLTRLGTLEVEAGGLENELAAFRAETGMEDTTILFALYEGGAGNPATPLDAEVYAQQVGISQFPVMADGAHTLANATPMTQLVHPEQCIIGPDMTILHCTSGHNQVPALFDIIKQHAGL